MFNVNQNAYAHDMNALKRLSRLSSTWIYTPTIEVEIERAKQGGFKVSFALRGPDLVESTATLDESADLPLGSFNVLVELETTTTLRDIQAGAEVDVDAFSIESVRLVDAGVNLFLDGRYYKASERIEAALIDELREVALAAYEVSGEGA